MLHPGLRPDEIEPDVVYSKVPEKPDIGLHVPEGLFVQNGVEGDVVRHPPTRFLRKKFA